MASRGCRPILRAHHAAYLRAAQECRRRLLRPRGRFRSILHRLRAARPGRVRRLDAGPRRRCGRLFTFVPDTTDQRRRFLLLLYACSAGATGRRSRRVCGQPRRLAGSRGRDAGDFPYLRWRLYQERRAACRAAPITRFWSALCYQLLGRKLPRRPTWCVSSRHGVARTAATSRSRRCAAAARIRPPPPSVCCKLPSKEVPGALERFAKAFAKFLAEMASPEKADFAPTAAHRLADLLSTFTAAWTLEQLGGLHRLDPEQVKDYAEALQRPEGGFRGGSVGRGTRCGVYVLRSWSLVLVLRRTRHVNATVNIYRRRAQAAAPQKTVTSTSRYDHLCTLLFRAGLTKKILSESICP